MNDLKVSQALGRIDRVTWGIIATMLGLLGYIVWQRADAISSLLVSALPWLFIFGCLLMHFFMHGGGHGHSGQNQAKKSSVHDNADADYDDRDDKRSRG